MMNVVTIKAGEKQPGERAEAGGATNSAEQDGNPAFDRWFNHHLGRLYDPVIQEPLPADLLKLLQKRFG